MMAKIFTYFLKSLYNYIQKNKKFNFFNQNQDTIVIKKIYIFSISFLKSPYYDGQKFHTFKMFNIFSNLRHNVDKNTSRFNFFPQNQTTLLINKMFLSTFL